MNIMVRGRQHSDRLRGLYPGLLLSLVAALFCYAPHSEARAKYADGILAPAVAVDVNSAKHYRLAHAGNQISMREAVKRAKRRFPGKVLAAKRTINRQGKVIYRIKIISNSSEIRTISIAADR